jgi:siroheme synthase
MPGQNYRQLAAKLKASGIAADTPCAVISHATTPQQRTHRSTDAELHRSPMLPAPALLVVGEVVRFADPVTLAQEFDHAAASSDKGAVASVLFEDFVSKPFRISEEPLA